MNRLNEKCVLLIVGPTGSGKTQLSLHLADRCEIEIVSADSRQVYRYMDVGTDKPLPSQRKAVPHHCIDIKEPDAYFSAGEYAKYTRHVIDEILSRDRIPVVVGGSGLYIRALVDGVFSGNYRDSEIRERLKREAEEKGLEVLYRRLHAIDPDAIKKIHAHDKRRIIRALEVCELTGEPISRIRREKTETAAFSPLFWGLHWNRETLYGRIEERVDRMVKSGLIEEVKRLREMGYEACLNSINSVGYKEVFDYLDGHSTLDETVSLIKRNTRRFAKKQMTWFRRDTRIQWINVREALDWDTWASTVLNSLEHHRCSS